MTSLKTAIFSPAVFFHHKKASSNAEKRFIHSDIGKQNQILIMAIQVRSQVGPGGCHGIASRICGFADLLLGSIDSLSRQPEDCYSSGISTGLNTCLTANALRQNQEKGGGKPCIRGLWITVYDILEYLAAGMTEQEILADFPDLEPEDIKACLTFAADRERKFAVAHPGETHL